MFKHVSHVTLQKSKNPSAPHPPPPTTTTYFARRPYSPPRPSNFPTFLGHAPSVKGPIHGVNAAVSADRALRQDVWLIPCSAKANKSPKYDYWGQQEQISCLLALTSTTRQRCRTCFHMFAGRVRRQPGRARARTQEPSDVCDTTSEHQHWWRVGKVGKADRKLFGIVSRCLEIKSRGLPESLRVVWEIGRLWKD